MLRLLARAGTALARDGMDMGICVSVGGWHTGPGTSEQQFTGALTLVLALGTEVMHLKQTSCLDECYDNQVCYRWPSRAPCLQQEHSLLSNTSRENYS